MKIDQSKALMLLEGYKKSIKKQGEYFVETINSVRYPLSEVFEKSEKSYLISQGDNAREYLKRLNAQVGSFLGSIHEFNTFIEEALETALKDKK